MARNAEVIRQWRILREIEASRGATLRRLAALTGVTTRTIRRDLEALQEAGFALYDTPTPEGKAWRLTGAPLRVLDNAGFTLGELSALYFARDIIGYLAGTPFQTDLTSVFAKLERALEPRLRTFLDRLPSAVQAKRGPATAPGDAKSRERIGQLLDAILHQRRVAMRYHSLASGKEKTYRVDPYRLVYAQGGFYLFAFVPSYEQVRTFAVDRIKRVSLTNETFDIRPGAMDGMSAHSLGVHDGPPERIEVEFTSAAAPYVEERVWHESQRVERRPDGSLLLSLDVCTDAALRSWILSFGPDARVRAPDHLAASTVDALAEASRRYDGPFDESRRA